MSDDPAQRTSQPPRDTPEDQGVGAVVGSRYRLEAVLGRGGMATVWRARDVSLDRPVAVKLLRPEILADPDLALRFRREAHAATVLRHPNIVACLDTGREGDQPYLVMELVDGEDLATRLRRDGALPQLEALRIASDVAHGLAVAHARGVVHRDVKPGNILLGTDGRARVTDFGIARLAAEAEAALPGTTLGSVHYFSPEQARGQTTTAASDVYGLGLVLYEMLTGARPFHGASPTEIALARVGAPAPSPRTVNPSIPPALDAVVRRATAPDPAGRHPNAASLAADLDALIAPAGADAPTTIVPVPVMATASPDGSDGPRPGRAAKGSPPVPGLRPASPAKAPAASLAVPSLLLVAVVLGGAFAAGALLLGGGPGSANEPAQPSEVALLPGETEVAATAAPTGTAAPGATAPSASGDPATDAPPPNIGPDGVADLCEPFSGEACPLPAEVYEPSRFEPPIRFQLGRGWSTFLHEPDILVLAREEGFLAVIGAVSEVYDEGEPLEPRGGANRLAGLIADNDDLDVLDDERGRIDGRRATVLDVVPTGDQRVPVFGVGENVYYAETGTVTRLIVVDVRDEPVVLVLEGANGFELEELLAHGESVLGSLTFR